MTPRVDHELADALSAAMTAVARCADAVAAAGCRPARTYVAGAGGNLRRALGEIAHRHRTVGVFGEGFDVRRVGRSELILDGGEADTIRCCGFGDAGDCDVRALVRRAVPEDAIWMRACDELPGLQVRGRVEATDDGYVFRDEPGRDVAGGFRAGADLARDLVASALDLAGRPGMSAALEVTLLTGSWVHLGTGGRWFADHATARAVVRLLGGAPGVEPRQVSRLGVCVDRECLILLEGLGWRQWPTPGLS